MVLIVYYKGKALSRKNVNYFFICVRVSGILGGPGASLKMVTQLNSRPVSTLTEFMKLVEERLAAAKGEQRELWHRGCADFEHDRLVPGLYRHPKIASVKDLLELEDKMISHFRQRSIPFVERPLQDDQWERLFFMQHARVPTRLLDWTENPFVALYFALTSNARGAASDSAVWMLDPVAWNRRSLDHMTFQEGVLSPDDTRLDYLKPGAALDTMNAHPVAVYGFHNSARIVAQRGVFTISGKDTRPMEEIYTECGYSEDCLLKVRLPADKKEELPSSLFRIGFTHSVIFPDLEGLAKETKNFFRFDG